MRMQMQAKLKESMIAAAQQLEGGSLVRQNKTKENPSNELQVKINLNNKRMPKNNSFDEKSNSPFK